MNEYVCVIIEIHSWSNIIKFFWQCNAYTLKLWYIILYPKMIVDVNKSLRKVFHIVSSRFNMIIFEPVKNFVFRSYHLCALRTRHIILGSRLESDSSRKIIAAGENFASRKRQRNIRLRKLCVFKVVLSHGPSSDNGSTCAIQ